MLQLAVTAEPSVLTSVLLQGFLGRVLDHNKRVQEAACSALASLEEAIGQDAHPGLLLPYLRVPFQPLLPF